MKEWKVSGMSYNRRDFMKLAGVAAAASLFGERLLAAGQDRAGRPNILLFFPDQHRFDWTSMNPSMPDITPNLKKLAGRGVHFSNAVCPSPLCAPSRACLASGKEYQRCGTRGNGNNYPVGQTTFYTLLKASGYQVLGCGKFDLAKPSHSWGPDGKQKVKGGPSKLELWGFTDGIDNAGKMDGWGAHRRGNDGPYFTYLKGKSLIDAYGKNYRLLDHDYEGPAVLSDQAYGDNWIARNGLELMKSVPKDKPWFLQVNFNGPHSPMDITKSMYDKFKNVAFPRPVDGDSTPGVAKKRRNYAAMICNIDHWLGVYVDEISKMGQLDNTIVVYCSDHGEMLADHGYWSKSRPLHPSACVPLVMAGPGIRSGVSCPDPVETLDLTASFLDYAGLKKPADMDSLSLRPFLGGQAKLPRSIVRSSLGKWTLVFDGQYKLIAGNLRGKVPRADQGKELVLYDLKNDPGEMTDVAAGHPDVVKRLKPMLSPVGLLGKIPK